MKSLYRTLALDGIHRYRRLYYPFIGTTIFFMILINICISMVFDETLQGLYGMAQMSFVLVLGVSILTLFYMVSIGENYKFIQKGKANENGLYLMLGMEKKHLHRIYFHELLHIYVISTLIGTALSLGIYKFISALFVKLVGSELNVLDKGILPNFLPLAITAFLFLGSFILLYVIQLFRSRKYAPIQFMNESKEGQKPPRFPLLTGIFAIVCIATGYYLSLTVTGTMDAIIRFWVAVLFVIVGTYAAFAVLISGLLNFLKKNENFYYKKSNFTSISGLIYRVRKSASSLATIAILSTMVIVVLTSGFSLYFGADELLAKIYPTDYKIIVHESKELDETFVKSVENTLERENRKGDLVYYKEMIAPTKLAEGNVKSVDMGQDISVLMNSDILGIYLDENSTLDFQGHDALLLSVDENSAIHDVGDMNLSIKEIDSYPIPFAMAMGAFKEYDKLIFKDRETFEKVGTYLIPENPMNTESYLTMLLDVDGPYDPDFDHAIREGLKVDAPDSVTQVADATYDRQEFYTIYAGVFFIGIILGIGFLVSTALAIYYKQLSEGLEDVSRFKTMRQLGMTDEEARKSINRQMGLVFFLPLLFAFCHSLFAMPILINFLGILGFSNLKLFIFCLACVCLAYFLFYLITYRLTAKIYNKIVLTGNKRA